MSSFCVVIFIVSSLYIHFPYCIHLCNYCDFYKKKSPASSDYKSYGLYLRKTFPILKGLLQEKGVPMGPLETLYLGGGTPSLWGPEGAGELARFFDEVGLELGPSCEFTMECNPDSTNQDTLLAWRDIGANRISLGLQTLNPQVLKSLDRAHGVEDSYRALELVSRHFKNFSIDFMLGLAFSDSSSRCLEKELQEVLNFHPTHASLYILKVGPSYVHWGHLPDDERTAQEYLFVSHYLTECGFSHYEVSNFARPGYSSQHNLAYWSCAPMMALGPSAAGLIPEHRLRYKWAPTGELRQEHLTEEQFHLERFYMRLRLPRAIPMGQYFEKPKHAHLKKVLKQWGHVAIEGDSFALTPQGLLGLDGFVGRLFAERLL